MYTLALRQKVRSVSQISPQNAPFGKTDEYFFGSVNTMSTLTKNTDQNDYFPYLTDLQRF
jgi:hypothetical protein